MRRKHAWLAVIAIVWIAVIFGTSCTWIDRDLFIRVIDRCLPAAWMQNAFAAFWYNGGGLALVKGYHVAEFAALFVLCNKVLTARFKHNANRAAFWSAAFCLAYAASDEWHQTFVPGRGGTWSDVVIDSAGILLAFLATRGLRRRKAAETSEPAGNRENTLIESQI